MTTSTDHRKVVELTSRELAVLHLLVEGCTAVAMAHRLGISVRTVQKHLEHVYRKLGVTNRLAAAMVVQGHASRPHDPGPAPASREHEWSEMFA